MNPIVQSTMINNPFKQAKNQTTKTIQIEHEIQELVHSPDPAPDKIDQLMLERIPTPHPLGL